MTTSREHQSKSRNTYFFLNGAETLELKIIIIEINISLDGHKKHLNGGKRNP